MIRSRGIDASELWVWELPIRMGLAKSSLAINRQSWQWKKRLSIERCGGRNPSLTWSIWTKSSQRRRKRWRRRRWRLPKWERSAQTSTRDVKSENIHDGWEKAAIWKKTCHVRWDVLQLLSFKSSQRKSHDFEILTGLLRLKRLYKILLNKKFEKTLLQY